MLKPVNINLVTQYLALSPHSTAEDIAIKCKISKATVLRVIRQVPAIYRSDQYKQAPTYYIDLEEYQDGINAGLTIAPPIPQTVDKNPKAVEKLALILNLDITQQAEVMLDTQVVRDMFIRAADNAVKYQSGQAQLDVLHWANTKEALANTLVFAKTLEYWCEHYLSNTVSDTPEFWSLFPKD